MVMYINVYAYNLVKGQSFSSRSNVDMPFGGLGLGLFHRYIEGIISLVLVLF